MAAPDGAGAFEFARNPIGAQSLLILLEYLKHDRGNPRRARQRLFQQLPHRLRHAAVMGVRVKAVAPRAASDVNFSDPVEPDTAERACGVEAEIERVAINIMQI